MSNLYRGSSKNAYYPVSIDLAKQFQRRRFFRNQPIRSNNCLWRPCFLTDRDEMSILYKVLCKECSFRPDPLTNMVATDDSCFWLSDFLNSSPLKPYCQMNRNLIGSIFGRSSFQRRRFLEIDQSETRIAYGGHVCQWIGTKWAIFKEDLP
jgi:hypothetical protein